MITDEQRNAALSAILKSAGNSPVFYDDEGEPFLECKLKLKEFVTIRAAPERKRVDLEKLKKTHRAYVDLENSVYSNVLFNERADGYNAAIEDMKQFDVFER